MSIATNAEVTVSAIDDERRAVVAYLLDRAQQYNMGSGIVTALEDVAVAIGRGEHEEAWRCGDLDDLKKRVDRIVRGRP